MQMFENPARYPELQALQAEWQCLRDEVMPVLFAARDMRDSRNIGGWKTLPLMVEPEDSEFVKPADLSRGRGYVPNLCTRVEHLTGLHAYALSIVLPGAKIDRHVHQNPLASASICLSGGAGATLAVSEAVHAFSDGSMAVFDYRRPHAVANRGPDPRVALIVAVDLVAGGDFET